MTARVTLTALRQVPGGFQASAITHRIGGVEYTLPIPFQEVIGSVVIFPEIVPTEDGSAISLQLSRWTVLHLERSVRLPLVCPDMAAAAQAARDFEADPGISWSSEPAELESWAACWVAKEESRKAGEQ